MIRRRRIIGVGPAPMIVLTRAREVGGHPTSFGKNAAEGTSPKVEIDPETISSVTMTDAWVEVRHRTGTYTRPVPMEDTPELVVETMDEVLQKIREALAAAPGASDELRLAAGWVQEYRRLDGSMEWRYQRVEGRPAPLPAGGWRGVGGGLSMRWALPKKVA